MANTLDCKDSAGGARERKVFLFIKGRFINSFVGDINVTSLLVA